MKKAFLSLVSVLFLASVSFTVSAQQLTPQRPNHTSYPESPGFDMFGRVSGWTNGKAKADGSGDGLGIHETYSTGESDSYLDMESVQTECGPGTPCQAGCGDNYAEIHAGSKGKHESGAFSSNFGADGASSLASTRSGVGLDSHTAIDTDGSGHHHDDWGHHGQD